MSFVLALSPLATPIQLMLAKWAIPTLQMGKQQRPREGRRTWSRINRKRLITTGTWGPYKSPDTTNHTTHSQRNNASARWVHSVAHQKTSQGLKMIILLSSLLVACRLPSPATDASAQDSCTVQRLHSARMPARKGGGHPSAPLPGSDEVLDVPRIAPQSPAQDLSGQHRIRSGYERLCALDRLGVAAMSWATKSSTRLEALLKCILQRRQ